jgi:hypothetical protein
MPLTEEAVVLSLASHLREEGYRIRLEVSNMGQSVDLVATRSRWVMTIEAKTSNWKRALHQCRAHALVADHIALALPLRNVPTELSEALHERGWGLIIYDLDANDWRWEIK